MRIGGKRRQECTRSRQFALQPRSAAPSCGPLPPRKTSSLPPPSHSSSRPHTSVPPAQPGGTAPLPASATSSGRLECENRSSRTAEAEKVFAEELERPWKEDGGKGSCREEGKADSMKDVSRGWKGEGQVA